MNPNALYVVLAAAFFVNALSYATCGFYGAVTEPKDECELAVTLCNAAFVLAAAFVLVVEYKPHWVSLT
jgi:hypothetical protein